MRLICRSRPMSWALECEFDGATFPVARLRAWSGLTGSTSESSFGSAIDRPGRDRRRCSSRQVEARPRARFPSCPKGPVRIRCSPLSAGNPLTQGYLAAIPRRWAQVSFRKVWGRDRAGRAAATQASAG